MRRSYRFWSRYSASVMSAVLCTIVAIEVLSCLFGYRLKTVDSLLSELRAILIISAATVLFSTNNGALSLYIPLVISHGETRKKAFVGFTLTKLGICAATVLVSAVLTLLSGEAPALRALAAEMVILLCVSAFGGIAGTLLVKTKWLGSLFFISICGGFGGTIGYLASGNGREKMFSALRGIMQITPWWMCIAAAALVCVDLGLCWATLRRTEIRL